MENGKMDCPTFKMCWPLWLDLERILLSSPIFWSKQGKDGIFDFVLAKVSKFGKELNIHRRNCTVKEGCYVWEQKNCPQHNNNGNGIHYFQRKAHS